MNGKNIKSDTTSDDTLRIKQPPVDERRNEIIWRLDKGIELSDHQTKNR